MKILAFDTATRATTVALCGISETPLEARDDPPPGSRPGHVVKLMPLIVELLDAGRLDWSDLELIAVGLGPGTFTGLRIGIAAARALAQARRLPIVGVSTLQSLALGALGADPPADCDVIVPVLDARRREVFAAAWRPEELGAAGAPLLEPSALAPAQLADRLPLLGSRPLAIGEGALAFREVLERSGALIPDDDSTLHRVTAANHCRLARGLRGGSPEEIQPDYLRLPDAELARRAARLQ